MNVPNLSGQRCQCTACGEFFNRVSTFDSHRVGEHGVNRRCLSPDEMRNLEWRISESGFWLTKARVWGGSVEQTAEWGNA